MDCPDCGSSYVIKNGKRQLRSGKTQTYHCNSCGRNFSDRPIKNSSYPAKVVVAALKEYASGKTLEKTSKNVNQRFKVNTSNSTVHGWVNRYRRFLPEESVRKKYRKVYDSGPVERETFRHSGVEYGFKRHLHKLRETGFERLESFVSRIEENCPHGLFENSDSRSSGRELDIDAEVETYTNLATEMANFALKPVNNRNRRHEAVQDFMLKCDSATVAVELPVWFYDKTSEEGVTGHVDIVQVRNGKVYVLDYKPKAGKVDPLPQLYTYASGLSFRSGIPFRDFRAAWFNRDSYFEFVPAESEVSI